MAISDDEVIRLAKASPVAAYRWQHRGRAPAGYVAGMAVAYAHACRDLAAGESSAAAVAAPPAGDRNRDALDWYAAELADAGAATATDGDRLASVFAILIGLGMRESSGKHCEGRDLSAANVSADTAEAGLFQVSYNSVASDPELPALIAAFAGRRDLLEIFDEGVHCSAGSWRNWGTGPGRDFQELTKDCPGFAVRYAAVLLRRSRRHWGPINRKEAEVTRDVVALLADIRGRV